MPRHDKFKTPCIACNRRGWIRDPVTSKKTTCKVCKGRKYLSRTVGRIS